jgi:hypothetical protein
MDFDEEQMRRLIRGMTPQSKFFKVLREELKRVGRWKYLPRGKPGDPLKQARQRALSTSFEPHGYSHQTSTKLAAPVGTRGRSKNLVPSAAANDSAAK